MYYHTVTTAAISQLFPYTTLFRSNKSDIVDAIESLNRLAVTAKDQQSSIDAALEELPSALDSVNRQRDDLVTIDRKSTRLNSSHLVISYAVFCLKKKKKHEKKNSR